MNFLQTPNISYLGLLSGLFKVLTKKCNSFNGSFFWDVSCHSYLIQMSHLVLLSDISWLVKLVISLLKINPNTLRDRQLSINFSFVVLYTLTSIYFPSLAFIICKPSCSHRHCLLSIVSFSLSLFFLVINGHKGSLR